MLVEHWRGVLKFKILCELTLWNEENIKIKLFGIIEKKVIVLAA